MKNCENTGGNRGKKIFSFPYCAFLPIGLKCWGQRDVAERVGGVRLFGFFHFFGGRFDED